MSPVQLKPRVPGIARAVVSRAREAMAARRHAWRASRPPVTVRREKRRHVRPDRPEVIARGDGLTVIAASADTPAWRVGAIAYGVPWLLTVAAGSVWYLGWGVPGGFGVRLLLWIVLMVLTAALHIVAVLTLWGTAYSRGGIEMLVIDPARITLRRQAGRFPIEMHIARGMIETAEAIAPRADGRPYPRIEVRAWRSAVRFGAGLTEREAAGVLGVLTGFFEREQRARQSLTTTAAGDTIAPTRQDASAEEHCGDDGDE